MNIGLTGGIACGKSTVAAMLEARGALLIDADKLAREVVEPGSPALAVVSQTFGQDILNGDGSLNRKRLGSIIFNDPGKRKELEGILHPPIRQLMLERMASAEASEPERLVVVDVPLLYESRLDGLFQRVMVVYVPETVQLERLIIRDRLSEEEARKRIEAQLSIERKKNMADIVIDNSRSREETERQVDAYWQEKGRL